MPEYLLIEKNENIAKRNFFDFMCFRSGLRIRTLVVLPVMIVAIYVHLTISNPAAFPAQPQEPYMPFAIIIMALIFLNKGGRSWSMDLKV